MITLEKLFMFHELRNQGLSISERTRNTVCCFNFKNNNKDPSVAGTRPRNASSGEPITAVQ